MAEDPGVRTLSAVIETMRQLFNFVQDTAKSIVNTGADIARTYLYMSWRKNNMGARAKHGRAVQATYIGKAKALKNRVSQYFGSERHHNRKVDAPSGTALMIADAAASALEYKAEYNYGRHERRMARPKNEIGISAVRGGTIVGDHTIIFAGHDEVIEIRHSAQSREIFANGAVKAAKFLADVQEAGMYDMSQLVNE